MWYLHIKIIDVCIVACFIVVAWAIISLKNKYKNRKRK